jgi:hypothetical protein
MSPVGLRTKNNCAGEDQQLVFRGLKRKICYTVYNFGLPFETFNGYYVIFLNRGLTMQRKFL